MRAWFRTFSLIAIVLSVAMMITPDLEAQRRGGSFGGSRRGYSAPRSAPRSNGRRSFGGSRRQSTRRTPDQRNSTNRYGSRPGTRTQRTPTSTRKSTQMNTFGGTRLNSRKAYTSRYGTPRKTETRSIPATGGATRNYRLHRYGGMGDGFMMGYVMGAVPWYYSTPFHPAFYYSRPYTAAGADGTTAVYPGTFQAGSLIFMIMLLAGGGFILYVWMRQKRQRHRFGGADMSKSSFG